MSLQVQSSLAFGYRAEVEALFFFNEEQGRCFKGIVDEIDRTGAPHLVERNHRLTIVLDHLPTVQTYFFLSQDSSRLVGAAMALRVDQTILRVLHWAVHPAWTDKQKQTEQISVKMLEAIQLIASRIHGLEVLELPYGKGRLRLATD